MPRLHPLESLTHLAPTPRKIEALGSYWALDPAQGMSSTSTHAKSDSAEAWVRRDLDELNCPLRSDNSGAGIEWILLQTLGGLPEGAHSPTPSMQNEAYRLIVHRAGIRVEATSEVGLFRAASTCGQLLRGAAHEAQVSGASRWTLPCVSILDWPEFERRGLMLDVSRDRVPRQARLKQIIQRCAELKYNHLELYCEHIFPYAGHEVVWSASSPITVNDWHELEQWALEHHVDLVPSQQTFGHMHRWLKHARYRPLAEVPAGVEHPFAHDPEPFSLCPTDPRCLELVRELLNQLLPHFSSEYVNVGCDETFDLGRGRSRGACKARGARAVYVEYLQEVLRLAEQQARRPLFWGDVLLGQERELPELPRSAVALLWGYEHTHPFEDQARRLSASGASFWVCPGTSSWQALTGRHGNMLANVQSAAAAGRTHGAAGYVLTDWGDFGHWQPESISWLGHVAGSCQAWNPDAALDHLPVQTQLHVARGSSPALIQCLVDLGLLVDVCGATSFNATPWFLYLRRPLDGAIPRGLSKLTTAGLAATEERAQEIALRLRELTIRAGSDDPTADLLWTIQLTQWACRLGRSRLEAGHDVAAIPESKRQDLARELQALTRQQRTLWLRTSRPGGLEDSMARLERLAIWLREGGRKPL